MRRNFTTRRRRIAQAVTALIAGAAVVAGLIAATASTDSAERRAAGPSTPADLLVLPSSPAPTSATTPEATTPDGISAGPQVFPSTTCTKAELTAGSALGIGIPSAARLASPGPEQSAFNAAVACLGAVAGGSLTLRTQLPIDATRRAAAGDSQLAEVTAFAQLLAAHNARGVISVRSHDFARCARPSKTATASPTVTTTAASRASTARPPATEVAELAPGAPLARCQYPSPALYSTLFSELHAAVTAAAPGRDILWTAWNEPDHPMFTLQPAFGEQGAARRAGAYWARAVQVAGADRVLAGEFADRDLAKLLSLRRSFLVGARTAPAAWAIHPYRDLSGSDAASRVVAGFTEAVTPAAVWLTEVTPRLSGRGGLGGNAQAQLDQGAELRSELASTPLRVILYLLTPPAAPTTPYADRWDSALADRQGRARPFVCGLAGLPVSACPGNAATYGE